jgi:peptide/nickel transport system substrate-binding protein
MMKRRKPSLEIVNEEVAENLTEQDRLTLADSVESLRQRRINRRSFLRNTAAFGLSATTLSSLLAACVAGGRSDSTSSGEGPDRNAKLAVAVDADADTVDPQAFKTIPGYYMLAHLYDQLIDVQAEDAGDALIGQQDQPRPMLASSIDVAEDLQTVTFKINPDARFQDGRPVTVEDVKYTFTRGVQGTQYTALLADMLTLTSPKDILTPDDQTVQFRLQQSNPMAERLLSLQVFSIQSKEVSEKHSTAKDPWADAYWRTHVYGTGPYTLKSWNRGEGWEFAPNKRYHNKDLPKNGGAIFRIISDPEERVGLLRSGELHVATQVAPKDASGMREGEPNVKLVSAPSPWNWALAFNNSEKPFNDVRVRQALSYAIPYESIIDNVMYGLARPLKTPIASAMPTSDPSFWKYETDMNKAKQLLAAAGYENGFSSTIDVFLGRAEDEQSATFIQESFRQLGVDVEINKLAEAQYQANRNEAKFAMMMIEWFSWVNDPFYHLFWNFQSENAFTNASRYSNPKVDKIIDQGLYETDEQRRQSLSSQAQKFIVEDAAWAFLFARDWYLPVASALQDVAYWPDQNLRLYWSYV